MYLMFCDCTSLTSLDLSSFDTSNVTAMANMFSGCSSLNALDVTGFDTSNVEDMAYMFAYCSSLQTIVAPDAFATDAVTLSDEMFAGCTALRGGAGTAFDAANPTDKTYARIDKAGTPGYFTGETVIPAGSYAIRFAAGEGTGTMADQICSRDKVYNLTKCAFRKSDKTFKGWAGSNGRRYDDGMLVFDLAKPGEAVTMTAIWE